MKYRISPVLSSLTVRNLVLFNYLYVNFFNLFAFEGEGLLTESEEEVRLWGRFESGATTHQRQIEATTPRHVYWKWKWERGIVLCR